MNSFYVIRSTRHHDVPYYAGTRCSRDRRRRVLNWADEQAGAERFTYADRAERILDRFFTADERALCTIVHVVPRCCRR